MKKLLLIAICSLLLFTGCSNKSDNINNNETNTSTNEVLETKESDVKVSNLKVIISDKTYTLNLENNKIINNDSTGNFLRIQKDSWGNSGSNGGTVTLNLTNQEVNGNIVVDSISKLTINLSNNSSFKGAINTTNEGEVSLTIDKSSSITLTSDTYIKSLTNEDSTNSNINLNGYKLYVNGVNLGN